MEPDEQSSDADDTALYDTGQLPNPDETRLKCVDSDSDDATTSSQYDHYEVDEAPIRPQRPVREHRVPACYRD